MAVRVRRASENGKVPPGSVAGQRDANAWSPLSVTAMASVEPAAAGGASGLFNTVRQVGAVGGVAVTGAVLAGLESNRALAFTVVFTLVADAGAIGTIRPPRNSTTAEHEPESSVSRHVRVDAR
jgi:hypothetical protein